MLDVARCLGYRKTEVSMQICPKRKDCKRFIEENKVNPFFQKMVTPEFVQKENSFGISADCENFTEFPF